MVKTVFLGGMISLLSVFNVKGHGDFAHSGNRSILTQFSQN